jgi:hypothetical protein
MPATWESRKICDINLEYFFPNLTYALDVLDFNDYVVLREEAYSSPDRHSVNWEFCWIQSQGTQSSSKVPQPVMLIEHYIVSIYSYIVLCIQ